MVYLRNFRILDVGDIFQVNDVAIDFFHRRIL